MSGEVVKIKGTKNGLQLVFDGAANYEAIEQDIRGKLESGSSFFYRGTVIHVTPHSLGRADRERLTKLFQQYGVILRTTDSLPKKKNAATPEEKPAYKAFTSKAQAKEYVQEMTVVNRTLHGGQEVRADGSVLICGNVNPGAQVIAGGSIDIRGTCRGTVHAGAYGNTQAFVIADYLMPMQIRIANLIAQAPDQMEKPSRAERASIKDGQIIIEPIER